MANITNVPMAYITVNRGRKKIKNKFVYLDNGTEFEVELFNPTQTTVLAKISINNKLISYTGIVLRPGERVFLERYLDDPSRFKFETYEVNGNTDEVKKAIEQNGLIKVEFYNEDATPTYNTYISPTITRTNWNYFNQQPYGTQLNSSSFVGSGINNVFYSSTSTAPIAGTYTTTTSSTSLTGSISKKSLSKQSVETGRVEKGSHSNQDFQTVNKKFYYYTTNVVEYHIKPVSQMHVDAKDLNKMNKFCGKCGRSSKQTDNFCSGCGNRF